MGLFDWYPFIRKKGYNPTVLYQSVLASLTTGTRRFDVMANCFPVIQQAYSNQNLPPDDAHRILENDIKRFGDPLNMRLYIDGDQAEEKMDTAKARDAKRHKALNRTEKSIKVFEERLNSNLRVRKRHFTDVKAGLKSSFHWSLRSRQEFANYMRHRGWTVIVCRTEADLAIAMDAQGIDVIISKDSDMTAYQSVTTLWRPVSNNLILVYKIPDVLATLGISRTQLTALAVVSRNDYHKNIYSLGPATNFSIIKSIGSRPDAREIVAAYLTHGQVVVKNTKEETFENSIRVFIILQQEPIQPLVQESQALQLFRVLQHRFNELYIKHQSTKNIRAAGVKERPKDDIVRLPSPKTFNRYRTVESPAAISKTKTVTTPQPARGPSQQISSDSSPSQQSTSVMSAPDADGHPPLSRTRIPRNRGRFSFKERTRKVVHAPPPKAKQFKLKFYQERPETVNPTPAKKTTSKANKPPQPNMKPIADKDKSGLLRSLSWHHPTAWLEIGTLEANFGRVSGDGATLGNPEIPLNLNIVQQEVVDCLQEAVQSAATVKRNAQRLIGEFVETLAVRMHAAEETKRAELQKLSPPMTMTNVERRKAKRDAVTKDEREILAHLCVRIKPNAADKEQQDVEQKEEDNTDLDDKGNLEQQFLRPFLAYLYSGNYPSKTRVGVVVNKLIDWLTDHGFHHPIRARRDLNETMPFTPSMLVRSVSVQLAVELQRIYGHGPHDLHKQATAMVAKHLLPPEADIGIQDDISAVENFLQLNRITGNRRRIIPLTSFELPFVSFTEPELASFFWKRESLKTRLTDLVAEDGSPANTLFDITSWIAGKGPGIIIKQFIADVAPQVKTSRQRRKAGHRGAVKLLTLEQIKSHLTAVQDKWVDPINYATKGYILRGSIRTDGFRLQLPAYKLRELHSVRYRRLEPTKLPPKLTSTVGGTDYYLQEIRRVITCKEDIEKLWPGVPVERIKTLTLDGGQVCVIGAFADLAEDVLSQSKGKDNANESSMEDVTTTTVATTTATDNQQSINATTSVSTKVPIPLPQSQGLPTFSSRTTFLNLAVKQKAVYQPTFRFRRWLEDTKQEQVSVDGQQVSISDIESRLPPLKGQGSSVINYVQELKRVEECLQKFYAGSGNLYKRQKWDMERARDYEYQLIANRLLGIVGGSLGERYDPSNPVLIGVGLGNFSITSGLSALNSTFLSYFIQKARSLGYIIVGLNEYYTSKKCPHCGHFIAQVTLRRFYCPECQVYHHRDVMAAENMANIVRGYLEKQERPEYLHPVAADGSLPWMAKAGAGPATSSTAASSSSNTTTAINRPKGSRKRATSTSSSSRGRRGKVAQEDK
ncbi:hypothetical protein KI688_002751 [Linnemannia hyalina]|uniref:Cas12f1-like TNB domain-containing protein n=1 Tax=Linnemannia hyalina TaxID=64524 RepID=A0A9P8BRY0_9FUNG|nr:hypothetical protein KI688_002751 [Linnemannia hyalina]